MRKSVVGGLVAVVLVATALVLAPRLWAQARGRVVTPGIELPMLAPGSEIGVSVREVRPADVSGATVSGGVTVEDVSDESPAARAGLRRGDVIVEFDGEHVRGVRHFSRLVLETPPDRTVAASIVRGGQRQTVQITPEASDRLAEILPRIEREIERGLRAIPREFEFDLEDLPMRSSRARLGMTLAPLSEQLAAYFGVDRGALVSTVDADSAAARAGIRAGDVITAVSTRRVTGPRDVTAALRDAAPGSSIEITLVRDKKSVTLKATLPERPTAPAGRVRV